MLRQNLQSLLQQAFTRLHTRPGGQAGRVRQGQHIHRPAFQYQTVTCPNHVLEFFCPHELGNRQFADQNQQLRLQQVQLRMQPAGTVQHFLCIRQAVATFGVLTGETAAYRCHIHPLAEAGLIQTGFSKPFEQGLACCPTKRAHHFRLMDAGRLPNRHHRRTHRFAHNHRADHLRA